MIKKKRARKILYSLFVFGFFCAAVGLGTIAFWTATLKIPDLQSFEQRKIIQSTQIYDRTGKILLWDIHKNTQRTVVPFEEISRHIKNATVAIEDSSFYQHKGIDIKAIFRAAFIDLMSGEAKQGASTITQQLVKNTFFTKEKSISRKIKEVIISFKIEKGFSKEEILSFYLNEIPYGGNSYGVEAASQNFFGKPAKELTLAQSAYLAAMTKAPTYYSPYGEHKDKLEERKNLVLSRMKDLIFISEEEEKTAKEEKIKFIAKGDRSIKAPHFSVFIRSYLENKYGQDLVEEEGLKVITTLDYDIQQKAEEIVAKYAKENTEKYNAKNAGLIAIDPKTGQILAMVGSKDYFDEKDEGNFNITLAYRQPGSAIKPFVYATAFKKGYTPNTVVFDVPTEFNAGCNADGTPGPGAKPDDCYMPGNYDNKFRGPISLRNSLAQSINISSVKVLYLAGLKDAIKTTQDMGITTLKESEMDRYGLTLVLGGGEVKLLELAGAYGVFANSGTRNSTTGILKVDDYKGNNLEEFRMSPKEVLDKNIALTITDILSDNEARMPMFSADSPLFFNDRKVAVKTGTTNNYRDAWVVGYTPNLVVGAWCGNNDNIPMEKKVAGFIVAPMWHEFFQEIIKETLLEDFEKPALMPETKPILAGQWKPEIHSILHWVNKNDPLGPAPEHPESDSQYFHWEYGVQKWAKENGY